MIWRRIRENQSGLCLFQGMNFIAGYLIIITKDEEKSFWLMDALLAKMLPGTFDGKKSMLENLWESDQIHPAADLMKDQAGSALIL